MSLTLILRTKNIYVNNNVRFRESRARDEILNVTGLGIRVYHESWYFITEFIAKIHFSFLAEIMAKE